MGIYEVMRVNDKVRRLIAQKAGEDMIRDAAIAARHDHARRGRAGEGEVGRDQRRGALPRRHRSEGSPHAVPGLPRRGRRRLHGVPALRPPAQRRLPEVRPLAAGRVAVLPVLHDEHRRRSRRRSSCAISARRPSCRRRTSPNSRTRTIVEELLRHAVGGARTRRPTRSRRRSAARSRAIIPTRSSTSGRSSRRWPRASPPT